MQGSLQTFLGTFEKWTKINVQFGRAMPFLFMTILGIYRKNIQYPSIIIPTKGLEQNSYFNKSDLTNSNIILFCLIINSLNSLFCLIKSITVSVNIFI